MDFRRGEYVYRLNGEATPVREYWEMRDKGSTGLRVTSRREAPGVRLSVAARMVEGRVAECDLHWLSERGPEARARYLAQEGGIRYHCGETGTWQWLPAPDAGPVVLYPLMRIFTGPTIGAVARQSGSAPVLAPRIGASAGPEDLLTPELTERRVRRVRRSREAWGECWQFEGGQYDAGARFWLDDEGWLQRYCWHQADTGDWDVRLQRD